MRSTTTCSSFMPIFILWRRIECEQLLVMVRFILVRRSGPLLLLLMTRSAGTAWRIHARACLFFRFGSLLVLIRAHACGPFSLFSLLHAARRDQPYFKGSIFIYFSDYDNRFKKTILLLHLIFSFLWRISNCRRYGVIALVASIYDTRAVSTALLAARRIHPPAQYILAKQLGTVVYYY